MGDISGDILGAAVLTLFTYASRFGVTDRVIMFYVGPAFSVVDCLWLASYHVVEDWREQLSNRAVNMLEPSLVRFGGSAAQHGRYDLGNDAFGSKDARHRG